MTSAVSEQEDILLKLCDRKQPESLRQVQIQEDTVALEYHDTAIRCTGKYGTMVLFMDFTGTFSTYQTTGRKSILFFQIADLSTAFNCLSTGFHQCQSGSSVFSPSGQTG